MTGEIAYSYVKGLQSLNVSAMVKHFAASSEPEQGLNTGPVHGGERELRTTWLPSYKRAIIDAGAYAIMSAYSSYDGVPQVADAHTLTEILRDEWGYDYFVSSDAGATDRLSNPFYICPSPLNKYNSPVTEGNECITLNALPAGGDVEMGGGSFSYRSIPELVASGRLDENVVDTAVSRVLMVKFQLGLFERPYQIAPKSDWSKIINTPKAKQLARELDRDSIVLLKNDQSRCSRSSNEQSLTQSRYSSHRQKQEGCCNRTNGSWLHELRRLRSIPESIPRRHSIGRNPHCIRQWQCDICTRLRTMESRPKRLS